MSVKSAPQTQAHTTDLAAEADRILRDLGVGRASYTEGTLAVHTPITGKVIGRVKEINTGDAAGIIEKAHAAFQVWRLVPAPKRGELVRLFGEELRANKEALGRLVSIEVGKI